MKLLESALQEQTVTVRQHPPIYMSLYVFVIENKFTLLTQMLTHFLNCA